MGILIDPPVGPYHPPAVLEAWLQQLREQLAGENDATNRSDIERAIAAAQGWLDRQRGGQQPPP